MITNFKKSVEQLERAKKVIPLGTQTFSKCYTQFSVGASPLFLDRGKGSHVWDIDGNEYIDWPFGLCAIVLGHAMDEINDEVKKQMDKGALFTLPSELEAEVSEMLCELIPCAEMVRFGKNGSDATAGAVRAARAITGRDLIACCGYHGWQDWYIGSTLRNLGVPGATRELTKSFKYNDLESLRTLLEENPGKYAAIVMEPMGAEYPQPGFLEGVRELATKHGALLVFDEIITGFRINIGGAQKEFGVIPDLACFGKSMANGFPISCVVGPKKYMQVFEEIFFSFTFGGELLSLAASKAVINFMKKNNVIENLKTKGQKLFDGVNELIKKHGFENRVIIKGYPARTILLFKDENGVEDLVAKTFFLEQCVARGVLFASAHNMSYATTEEDIEKTLSVYDEVMGLMKGKMEIKGTLLQAVFRKP